jgi:tRNA(Ile)-lysidine synthetase-like protein
VVGRFLAAHGLAAASGVSVEALVAALIAGRESQATLLAQLVVHKGGRLFLPKSALVAYGPELRPLVLEQLDDACGLWAERVDVDDALWAKLSRGDIAADAVVYLNVPPGADLAWRGRLDGDRYQPLGSPGTAKLSDLLINRKIPVERRESLPVVLVDNTIHWVPGLPPAHTARLVGPQKGALRLTWLTPCLS